MTLRQGLPPMPPAIAKLRRHRGYPVPWFVADVDGVPAEPPSHLACAVWSAMACPFLTRPHASRREAGRPEEAVEPAGVMLRRNPGVALVWVVERKAIRRREGLFDVGEPLETLWFAEGREATRAEVEASIESGLPILREMAEAEGRRAVDQLAQQVAKAEVLLPA